MAKVSSSSSDDGDLMNDDFDITLSNHASNSLLELVEKVGVPETPDLLDIEHSLSPTYSNSTYTVDSVISYSITGYDDDFDENGSNVVILESPTEIIETRKPTKAPVIRPKQKLDFSLKWSKKTRSSAPTDVSPIFELGFNDKPFLSAGVVEEETAKARKEGSEEVEGDKDEPRSGRRQSDPDSRPIQ